MINQLRFKNNQTLLIIQQTMEKIKTEYVQSNQLESQDHLKENKPENFGKWDDFENRKYLAFLDYNKQGLSSKFKRRQSAMFTNMSKFIETRTPVQCRSHHQKLLQKFKTLKYIIKVMKKDLGREVSKALMKEFKDQLSLLKLGHVSTHRERDSIGCQTDISWINSFQNLSGISINQLPYSGPTFFMPMYNF